jgi:hypothetical protein
MDDPFRPAETPQRHRATEALSKFYVVSPPPSVERTCRGHIGSSEIAVSSSTGSSSLS